MIKLHLYSSIPNEYEYFNFYLFVISSVFTTLCKICVSVFSWINYLVKYIISDQ